MRKWIAFIPLLILICCALTLKKGTSTSEQAPIQVKELYQKSFQAFHAEVDVLAKTDILKLQQQLIKTRIAYKRIEFLMDYLAPKYVYLHINGGPLPKINEDRPDQTPIKPNGLQALDEILFSDELNFSESASITAALQEALHFIAESHFESSFENRITIEAIRSGLVRVFTLGVTGFDTPGSGNAMEEAKVSMETMLTYFKLLEVDIQPETADEFKRISKLFAKGIKQLKRSKSFDSFDRMCFLKACINPLYKALRRFQALNGISLTQYKTHAQNYEATNLFDAEFLDRKFFQEFSFLPLDNPKSVRLGKMLFYDPILSSDNKMSCASCHDPKQAFTDGLPTSKSNTPGIFVQRNSPTLIDASFSRRFFHDMRVHNLEEQVPHAVENPLEFNTNFPAIASKLAQRPTYVQLFEELYGPISTRSPINHQAISNALAAYVNSLVSFNSPFDQYIRNEPIKYPQAAVRGFNLFMGKAACGTCHFPPAFNGTVPPFYTDSESEVLGVTVGFDTLNPVLDDDLGRFANGLRWEKWPHFKRSFKTPGLRNVALTAPYMHNGSFETLEEVLEFYNRGGGAGLGLEVENQTLSAEPLGLSEREMADIVVFLGTLGDTVGMD